LTHGVRHLGEVVRTVEVRHSKHGGGRVATVRTTGMITTSPMGRSIICMIAVTSLIHEATFAPMCVSVTTLTLRV
jgi:hypothetical protein